MYRMKVKLNTGSQGAMLKIEGWVGLCCSSHSLTINSLQYNVGLCYSCLN
jgi:hypothetical protein